MNIANIAMAPGANAIKFIAELDALYDKLESMNYEASDSSKIVKLLNNLPKGYLPVCAALHIQTSKTWESVQNLVQNEYESLQQNKRGTGKSGGRAFYSKKKDVECWKCSYTGHIKSECKSKKGKPRNK